jgi:hypothetical protein
MPQVAAGVHETTERVDFKLTPYRTDAPEWVNKISAIVKGTSQT